MFCPKCGVEHRAGFKRCSDCDVDLVENRPVHPGGEHSKRHEMPVAVWRGNDPVAFSAVLAALEDAGISAQEFSLHDQFAQVLAVQPGELAILVQPDDVVRAAEIVREALEPQPPEPTAE